MTDYRIGIDFGGTKIEIAALARKDGQELVRRRIVNPGYYDGAITAIRDLVAGVDTELGGQGTVGIGIPGSISPDTGVIKNANATWLNNQPFGRDLTAAVGREVRVENDANCFALSEAVDGAGAGFGVVLGVIIGTGMGAGIIVNGKLLIGAHHIAGEWGHVPLPWPRIEEMPLPKCFCGNEGCLERYLSGSALAQDWKGPGNRSTAGIESAAEDGDQTAIGALDRYMDRMARACAMAINFLDPDVIVLGGGVSNLQSIYDRVPLLMPRYVITPRCNTPIVRNRHGDSSGVRGAAWLWSGDEGVGP
ncbi:ROK family protein [Gluconacetobacter diazotrophicus]|uniref:Glucokinase protein n=2 Tax=Gluconacetobacter diazotrophicus TaxID=33996 RepID=A9HIS0_GLUDA|nr:ROK family protein [Gluconacetobacter diazotrophicus]MBB2156442.1 ROK family protein [Gluconacetobacter diazotrophicus]CAP55807.1 Glucokinase protein [Gluconacetobacter diazotrophicus PA1 5]